MMAEITNCPVCRQRCPVENLGCGRGETAIRALRSGEPGIVHERHAMGTADKLTMTFLRLGRMGSLALMDDDPQSRVLGMIAGHGNWMTQTQLAKRMGPQAKILEETLQTLETDGFIHRSPSEYDGGETKISLTERGLADAEKLRARRSEKAVDAFHALDEAEQDQLLTLMGKLDKDWRVRFGGFRK